MPPCAINSPKKKRLKRKGLDASGRAALLKLKMVLHDVPAVPMQGPSHPPKGFLSLSPNIPVNPQAPEPAHKGQKGLPKVRHAVPPPYSLLTVTNGPVSIDNTGPGFPIHQPGGRFGFIAPPSAGHSLHKANNPHIAVSSKAVKNGPKGSSTNDSDDENKDEDKDKDGERKEDKDESDKDEHTNENKYQCHDGHPAAQMSLNENTVLYFQGFYFSEPS
ncbi:uncharacterized protein F5147DRAFT_652011 [Suillus discolor]|uniref:Uncharacterized protein n=1 Tax=Suillus discolor TaxID=1912936 RepID=A0A9P7F8N5_9AGAM|nr:uncharacterized protein F5147DRAFT_652011 [Suillus discolor]KAG2110402.1 hypothetical protein F5147DRAFT_652011 [Suillus discolor]